MPRRFTLGLVSFVFVISAMPAHSQSTAQEIRYLVAWKSRYNDRNYRSEWFYGDLAIAESVVDELRQFHAFKDVHVITGPMDLSPDGISGKIPTNLLRT